MTRAEWRRIGILGGTLLLALTPIALGIAWVFGPIWSSIDGATSDAALIARLRALAAEKPAYQAALARARSAFAAQNALYHDTSAELAAAELQNTAQGLVAQNGGQVISSAIDPPSTIQGLQVIAVSLSFSLPPTRLAQFLAAVDTQNPYLVIQSLDIRSTDAGQGTSPLDVQMQINGFRETP